MTFAPIHDFVPRKFPKTLNQITDTAGNVTNDWKNLPAFVADRQTTGGVNDKGEAIAGNPWLEEIFGSDKTIPKGENSTGVRQVSTLSPLPLAPITGGATINDIVAPLNIPQ
jgi:hypothetical protein